MALSCAGDLAAAEPPKWRASGSTQWTATEILFSDGTEGALRRFSTSAAGEYGATDALTLTLGVGVSPAANLTVLGARYHFDPGPIGVLGVSYLVLSGVDAEPFVVVGGTGSAATSKTFGDQTLEESRFTALDFRAAVTVGKVFFNAIAPYASVRGFGGPVTWEREGAEITGTDKHHYAVGVGTLVTAGWIDAFFEVVPLGERSLNTGLAFTF